MSEQQEQPNVTQPSDETQNTGQTQPNPTQQNNPSSIPYDRFQQVIQQRNDLQQRLEAIENAAEQARQQKLEEDGKLQELIEALRPEAERAKTLESQVQEYQARDQVELNAELEALDDTIKALIPEGSPSSQLAWVRNAKRAGLFNKPSPPKTDAGQASDPKPRSNMTEGQRQAYERAVEAGYIRKRKQ